MSEIERIKSIVAPIAQKHGVEKVWLFGSRASGDAKPDSDYDFLISMGTISSKADAKRGHYSADRGTIRRSLGCRHIRWAQMSDSIDFVREMEDMP